jgi:putative FmdB family regulatory protein
MPIYEYRCTACGAAKEHLQKMSDEPIAQCPACGSAITTSSCLLPVSS